MLAKYFTITATALIFTTNPASSNDPLVHERPQFAQQLVCGCLRPIEFRGNDVVYEAVGRNCRVRVNISDDDGTIAAYSIVTILLGDTLLIRGDENQGITCLR